MIRYSSESFSSACGTAPAASNSTPMWMSSVASPPSSTIESGPLPSGQVSICSVHHQYSASDSPFQANTGTPDGASGVPSGPTTTAAAAWSCVEKMLQLTQRTSAPSATRVSIRTAVCTVMCSEPATFLPASGFAAAVLGAQRHQPGHLVLGELDLLAAERGQRQVGDLEGGDRARRVGRQLGGGRGHAVSFDAGVRSGRGEQRTVSRRVAGQVAAGERGSRPAARRRNSRLPSGAHRGAAARTTRRRPRRAPGRYASATRRPGR